MSSSVASSNELSIQGNSHNGEQPVSVLDTDEQDNKLPANLQFYDMWALGITIVIGGQYFAWNAGLTAGFGSLFLATFFIATGYYCLSLCIAELSSALPFAGGSYGITRITIGYYPGYLVGCFDSIESVAYVAVAAVTIGQMITTVTKLDSSWEPLYWFLFYGSATGIQAWGGNTFWKINMGMALVSLGIVLLYILGSAKFADFDEYTPLEGRSGDAAYFRGGMMEFMKILPVASWFFVGVESINLACKDIKQPKKRVPLGYVTCVTTLLLTCMGVLFVCCSLTPGVNQLAEELNPLNFGFKLMFKISDEAATALSLPATYATAFGFMFCYGRQIRAMGNSGLLNKWVGETNKTRNTPIRALLVGWGIGYVICVVMYFVPSVGAQIFNVCMLGAFGAYLAQLTSFIIFRLTFTNIKREFKSPLGIFGAVYGMLVFSMAFIGIVGFQDDQVAIVVYLLYIVSVSIYYVLVVKHRQYFSEEEQLVLFTAHLSKNNREKASRLRKGKGSKTPRSKQTGKSDTSVSSCGDHSMSNSPRNGANSPRNGTVASKPSGSVFPNKVAPDTPAVAEVVAVTPRTVNTVDLEEGSTATGAAGSSDAASAEGGGDFEDDEDPALMTPSSRAFHELYNRSNKVVSISGRGVVTESKASLGHASARHASTREQVRAAVPVSVAENSELPA